MHRETSAVYDLLIRRSDPFALLLGNYAFGSRRVRAHDKALPASRRKAGAPSGWAKPTRRSSAPPSGVPFGCTAAAGWIGLALPRVMARMPYGKSSDPCEAFPFEEIEGPPAPRQMLYASPAVFCALLLAQA